MKPSVKGLPSHGSIWHHGYRVDWARKTDAIELVGASETVLWQVRRDALPKLNWVLKPMTMDGVCWVGILT